ncbi:MAG: hypothetical protein GWN00_05170 [Aliifodinibius sp.]|nr:hypothetical protein [Fodinibius sp.]NIV10592.1 hypothetical protein [Fodinibius sp.]NIY24220.1 hypothetical protein [Fodinibius sp.]
MKVKKQLKQDTKKFIIVLIFVILASSSLSWSITTKDWVTKAQSWLNARDNGKYTATRKMYRLDNGTDETQICTVSLWFEDDLNDGWSFRTDTEFEPTDCSGETVIYKELNTPDGNEAFVNDTEVFPSTSDIVSSYICQSHNAVGKAFYAGDPNQTALQALESVSTSRTASEEYLVDTHCFKLEITWDVDEINSLISDSDGQYDPNDTVESKLWIKSSDGEAVKEYHKIIRAADSETFEFTVWWSNVNTSPSIPSGTFDLTAGSPSVTAEDAIIDWVEANCE